jgi:hypothetical protein
MNIDSPATQVQDATEKIKIDVNTKDDDLVKIINFWMKESSNLHEEMKRVQDENEKYYKGIQTKKGEIPNHQSDAVDNRIFTSIETIVPIITTNPPQFVAEPAQNTEESEMLSNAVEQMLSAQYSIKNVRDKLREAIRYMLLYRLFCIKVYWDETIDDVNLKAIKPQRIWVPPYGLTTDELPYIIEKIDMTFEEIEYYFGKDVLKNIGEMAQNPDDEKSIIERVRTIWEVWTDDMVVWKYGNLILKKQPNPYWDWEGTQGDNEEALRFFNHFASTKKPYIIRSPFSLGNCIIGDTDLIQQGIPLADIINTHVRQITNCANKTGNPRLLIDSSVMSQEEAGQITNAPGQILMGDGIADQNKFRYEDVKPLPNYIFENMVHAERELDNIMGTHSTTRGERSEPETLGGRLLLKQQDYGRIGDIVGILESAVTEIGNWFVQLFKLYYDKTMTVKLFGENGIKFVSLTRDQIEDGLEIIIKAGSTLPTDEISKHNEALQLWQMGVLDPITLYERLKFPNPDETAQRLVMWLTGQLVPGQPLPGSQPGQPATEGTRQPGVSGAEGTDIAKSQLRQQGNELRGQ